MSFVLSARASVSRSLPSAFGERVGTTPSTPYGWKAGWGYRESSPGLTHIGHRMYDPTTGRFLTRDPILAGSNHFAYCDNDPLNAVDPNGLLDRGLDAANRARGGLGRGPKDCEDWIREYPYPGEWTPGRAAEIPGKLKKQKDWEEIPNDGKHQLKPGDLICTGPGKIGMGHVEVVAENGKDSYHASYRKHNGQINKGRVSKSKGKPLRDQSKKRKGRVTIWRPKDKKK